MIKALFGHLFCICSVSVIKRITRKLRIIILLHLGLVTLRIHYCWTCPWLPKPMLFISGGTRILLKVKEKYKLMLGKIFFRKIKFSEIIFVEDSGKHRHRTSWRFFLQVLEHLEYGINISQKTGNRFLVLWDQHLSNHSVIIKLWIFETLKPTKTTKKLRH